MQLGEDRVINKKMFSNKGPYEHDKDTLAYIDAPGNSLLTAMGTEAPMAAEGRTIQTYIAVRISAAGTGGQTPIVASFRVSIEGEATKDDDGYMWKKKEIHGPSPELPKTWK
jgi:hypothetical protein